ncbi:serine threonine protein [Ophiostoma piceae UAMH 11346]|uniref:Serine threonine protein n=1 Tax=Ophiostoma piceae (strain UAMH 11346) TaxID=1262450 RepID=S3C5P6_OPHP1|nr:serine threonine protein [Ophiostoma piceae UAMH 11346]
MVLASRLHPSHTVSAMAELLPLPVASPALPQTIQLAVNGEGAPRAPLAYLEIESLTFGEFKQGQIITIGRDSKKCNLRFQNKEVSFVHCEIYSVLFDKDEQYPALVYVRDCQSASGTFVNGNLVGKAPSVSPARLLENNDTISLFADQYLIKETILGSGAFANVYLAVDIKTRKQLICKVHDLSSLQKRYESAIERVDREMAIWSQLDHPNIIAFHRAFKTSNTMYTFADLATGGDLFSLLEREQTIPELEIKWIISQVLRAVDYLHCKGVAHRDIKPENVLCSSSFHMHHRIVLADFGCAGVTSLGRLTSHVGTDVYRAPEAQRAAQPHGVAVDIWSIGVLALQLLSGNEPVEEFSPKCTESDIESIIMLINLRRVGQCNGPISQNGLDFILSCLNPQPLARPSAAKAAKHLWFRESAHQILQFQEREKQLSWKPRGILFPAVVALSGRALASPPVASLPAKRVKRGQENFTSTVFEVQPFVPINVKHENLTSIGEYVPDSAPPSRETTPGHE